MTIHVEIGAGELIDRITILEIKLDNISDPKKLENIRTEYAGLLKIKGDELAASDRLNELTDLLKSINARLWVIEDDIRELERSQDFGTKFVALARSVYRTNDERAACKRLINDLFQSRIVEEKSYSQY